MTNNYDICKYDDTQKRADYIAQLDGLFTVPLKGLRLCDATQAAVDLLMNRGYNFDYVGLYTPEDIDEVGQIKPDAKPFAVFTR